MPQWLDAQVVQRTDWNDHLFSLAFHCAEFPNFSAGQFTKVGIEQEDGKVLSRPYSLVNAPSDAYLEILAVPVEEGALSPKLHQLNQGDWVKVMAPCTGFLTLDEIPDAKHLWMMATGTGVGPFISILSDDAVWQRFDKITLVYGARYASDLAYSRKIGLWQKQYPNVFKFVSVVSREPHEGSLSGRIPALISRGLIEQQANLRISADDSQIMLCGNPAMIQDSQAALEAMGLKKHLRRAPGQISMERYW